MDREEKNRLRDHIGEHLEVAGTRLTDDEAVFLRDFVDNYENEHKGQSATRNSIHTGWSSDGKYVRDVQMTDTFADDVCIRHDYSYRDDDGQSGESTKITKDARGVLNWFRDNR